jgi:hypothetical protein
MKTLLCAAIAAMVLSTGTAFADAGGGNGLVLHDPYSAPSGFYDMNPGYQAQQAREAYVINQERAWQLAHAANHNPPIAQSMTPRDG